MTVQQLIDALELAKEIFGPTAKVVVDVNQGGTYNVTDTFVFDENEIGLSTD